MGVLDELFDKATSAYNEETWREAVDIFIDNKLEVSDLAEYIDEEEPHTQDDWTIRAELFEAAMYLLSAVREREKGNF